MVLVTSPTQRQRKLWLLRQTAGVWRRRGPSQEVMLEWKWFLAIMGRQNTITHYHCYSDAGWKEPSQNLLRPHTAVQVQCKYIITSICCKNLHFHFLPFPSRSIENERVAGKCIHEQPVTCQVSVYTNISSVGSIADKGGSNISRNTIFDSRRRPFTLNLLT